MGFSRQEYWSGLPCPPPGDRTDPGMKPQSLFPALAGGFLPLAPPAVGVGQLWFSPRVSCCCLVAKLCSTRGDPMDGSTPVSPVFHDLPEFAQVYIHWVRDAIQPSPLANCHGVNIPTMTNFKLLLCSQPALPTSVNLTLSAGKQAQATSGVPVSSSTHPLPPLFLPCNTPSVRSLTNLTYLNLIYSCPLNARAFPGGSASLKKKQPTCQCRKCKRHRFNP